MGTRRTRRQEVKADPPIKPLNPSSVHPQLRTTQSLVLSLPEEAAWPLQVIKIIEKIEDFIIAQYNYICMLDDQEQQIYQIC